MKFDIRIQIQEIFLFIIYLFFFLGGGGGGGGGIGYEHKSHYILYTRHIVTTSSIKPYSLMKLFLMVFKIEAIVALTIKGR